MFDTVGLLPQDVKSTSGRLRRTTGRRIAQNRIMQKCNKTIVETFNVTLIGDVNLDGKIKLQMAILRIALGLDNATGTTFITQMSIKTKITLADAAGSAFSHGTCLKEVNMSKKNTFSVLKAFAKVRGGVRVK